MSYIKIPVPYWAFPSQGDDAIDFEKMAKDLELKGDYAAAKKARLKVLVMKNYDLFSPVSDD